MIKCKEPTHLHRLTTVLAIASLVFIGVTSAALGILWHGPKKGVSLKLDATRLNAQHVQQDAVDVESKSGNLTSPTRSTSGYPSSILTQGVVVTGLPGSIDQTPPLTTKPTLRGFGAESDGREWRATRRHTEAASPHTKKRRRRADSSFAAIGHALGFRIVQRLNKP